MQGITILPTSLAVEIGLSIIYLLWLVLVIAFYVFSLSGMGEEAGQERKRKETIEPVSFEMNSRNGSLKLGSSRKGSCTSESSRGPQPLTKNIISDEKMIQLRKKSMDFMEAQRQMKQLNAELGLKHQLARELEEEDEGFKVRMEKKDSNKSDPDSDLDDSLRAPLHSQRSSPELEDPFPSLDRNQLKQPSTSDEEEDDYVIRNLRQTHSSSSVNRASTFNYGFKADTGGVPVNIDSDTSEKGGSLRITRHSKRARGKMEHIFKKPDSLGMNGREESPTFPPSLNITPCTPPLNHHPMLLPDQTPQLEESTDSFTPLTAPVAHSPRPGRTSPMASRRRRRAGVVPPPIMSPPATQSPTPGDQLQCPFHNSAGSRSSPRPCRRNPSPNSSAGEDGTSPKPVRKKKVSVAQIEATVVPPTPVQLEPPKHMTQSPSFNTMRTHEDAFADNAFRSVMQISQDAICCANSVGDIVYWSTGACKMFGYTPGEAIGSSLEVCVGVP